VRFGNRLRDLVGAFAGVDAMSREWWADGPPDDVDAMALEAPSIAPLTEPADDGRARANGAGGALSPQSGECARV